MSIDAQRDIVTLLDGSGLTPRQVARLFGVTVRTLQSWRAGTLALDHHIARLERLVAVVMPLGDTPEERRAALLKSSNGPSRFHRLLDEMPKGQVIQVVPVPVRERLGL